MYSYQVNLKRKQCLGFLRVVAGHMDSNRATIWIEVLFGLKVYTGRNNEASVLLNEVAVRAMWQFFRDEVNLKHLSYLAPASISKLY